MAGSGKFKGQQELKNKAMLVVRNITKQEVTNVIFPNGITVGADGAKFKNGMRIHGNAQVSGVINAQGYKVNGQDLSVSGQPFLFLDVDSYAVAFDDTSDSSPTPHGITITVTQQGQTATLQSSDIVASDKDSNPLTVTSFSVTATSVGNSTSTAIVDVSSLGRSGFPVTITASKESLTSTKTIVSVVGGDDGSPGSTPPTPETLFLDLNTSAVSFDDSTVTSPTPSSVGITVTQSGQTTDFVAGDLEATSNGGSSGDLNSSISGFNRTSSSTGNSVSTATLTLPTGRTGYPITVRAANDGLTSQKTIVAVVGGDDGSAGASGQTIVPLDITFDFTSSGATMANPALGVLVMGAHANATMDSGFNMSGTTFVAPGQSLTAVWFNATTGIDVTDTSNYSQLQGANYNQAVLYVPPSSVTKVFDVNGTMQLSNITHGGTTIPNLRLAMFTTSGVVTSSPNGLNLASTVGLKIGGSVSQNLASGTTNALYVVTAADSHTLASSQRGIAFGLLFGPQNIKATLPTAGTVNLKLQLTLT